MVQSRVFRRNSSQVIHLPKSVAFPAHVKRVAVIKQGSARLLMPEGESWKEFFDGPRLDADFLSNRGQPAPQRRRSG